MSDAGNAERLSAVAAAATRDPLTVTADGTPRSSIDGVVVERVRVHEDHRGVLMPAIDVRADFWIEPIAYAYVVTINPGVIKGWGMHEHQADRYFVARGHVRVALFDGRVDSPTAGVVQQLFCGPASPSLVRIPAGVWHADQNWGTNEALIVNFPTRAFDPDDPDKQRIDPHAGVIPFDWSLRDS